MKGLCRIGLLAAVLGSWGSTVLRAESPPLPPLTTVSGSPRLPGKFVWADLVTDDVPKAQKFYGELFGWTFRNYGGYMIAFLDSEPVGGMFQRPRPTDRNPRPRWFGYISVPDVQRAEKAVTAAGGRVLAAPRTLPQRGEQAVFADAEDAVFGVIKSRAGDPEDYLAAPGDWVWIELLSRDARKAGEFYRSVAGYDIVENTTSPRPDDYVFVSEGYARAAALTIPSSQAKVQPNWLLFIRVTSVSDTVARVSALGGQVLLAPDAKLLDGKVAVVADPTGAAIGVMEWSAEQLKGGR
jgi:predicted enzyme related to lactoylglutathione lyase